MMSFLGLFNRVSFVWKNNYFLTLWIQESLGRFNSFSFFENIDDFFIGHRYANRAKNIKNKPKINEDPKDALLREFQEEIGRWYNTNHVKLLSAVWHIISMSYIAGSARGPGEANPVSWLAIRGRKMRLSCQLAKTTTNQTNKQTNKQKSSSFLDSLGNGVAKSGRKQSKQRKTTKIEHAPSQLAISPSARK